MQDDGQRNMLIAMAVSIVILVGWQYFFGIPGSSPPQQTTSSETSIAESAGGAPQPGGVQEAPTGGSGFAGARTGHLSRAQALAQSPRVAIDTPRITGSISLKGGRIDDIVLTQYRETVSPDSPNITLLSPSGFAKSYYAEFGWVNGANSTVALPSKDSLWEVVGGNRLSVGEPLRLRYDNGQGAVFTRQYEIDADYMIKVTQQVENNSAKDFTIHPYALISRRGTPVTSGFFILHEGLVGVLGEHGLQEIDYTDLTEEPPLQFSASRGWLGITDKYWASVLIPTPGESFDARMSAVVKDGTPIYQTDYLRDGYLVAAGERYSVTGQLFAGAKVTSLIDAYEVTQNIEQFELLIDWGWFYFITKPLFYVIDYLFVLVGNFGVAILLVTVLVKILFFPLANRAYVSMSKMKALQPELVKLRERHPDDRAKQQQGMMELYKREKVNPMQGCLPILLQIPVFFALYKVLFVTIEMRQAPFFGWIQDLAAPDPTTLFNLFGLIPWDPPQMLTIGIWPIIMGITMFIQMRLNPPPPDPIQAQIFNWMPLVFTFLLASFPAGLVIYWAWNNSLSIAQQMVIMHRQGVKIELWSNIAAIFSKKPAPDESD